MVWIELPVSGEEFWSQFPETLSIAMLVTATGKAESTVWRWVGDGVLPAHKIGRTWVVYREEIQHRLEEPDVHYPTPRDFLAQFPNVLAIEDLAEILGRTRQTAYRWLSAGFLPGHLLSGRWLIYKHELAALLEETSNQTLPKG